MTEPSPTTDPSKPPARSPKPATRAKRTTPAPLIASEFITAKRRWDWKAISPTRGSKVWRRFLYGACAVLVLLGAGIVRDELAFRTLDKYKVGACVDAGPSEVKDSLPNLVDCLDSSAKLKILEFYYSPGAEVLCPDGTDTFMELRKAKYFRLLCLTYV